MEIPPDQHLLDRLEVPLAPYPPVSRAILNDYEFRDVKFEFQNVTLQAHGIIILERCPKLGRSILTFENKTLRVNNQRDLSSTTFNTFLLYLYTSSVTWATNVEFELYGVADYYQMQHLKMIIIKKLAEGLCLDNWWIILNWATKNKLVQLQVVIHSFMKNNAGIIESSDQWYMLTVKAMTEMAAQIRSNQPARE